MGHDCFSLSSILNFGYKVGVFGQQEQEPFRAFRDDCRAIFHVFDVASRHVDQRPEFNAAHFHALANLSQLFSSHDQQYSIINAGINHVAVSYRPNLPQGRGVVYSSHVADLGELLRQAVGMLGPFGTMGRGFARPYVEEHVDLFLDYGAANLNQSVRSGPAPVWTDPGSSRRMYGSDFNLKFGPHNLVFNSMWNGPAVPTGWSTPISGTSTKTTSDVFSGENAMEQVAVNERSFHAQSLALIANRTYTIGAYFESGDAPGEVLLVNGDFTGVSGTLSASLPGSLPGWATATFTLAADNTGSIRVGAGCSAAVTGTVKFSRIAIWEGEVALTDDYVPTDVGEQLYNPRFASYQGSRNGFGEKIVRNLLHDVTNLSHELSTPTAASTWDDWTPAETATGTVVLSGTSNEIATCSCPVAGDRAYLARTGIGIKADHTYAVSVDLSSFSSIDQSIIIFTGLTISAGSQTVVPTGDGRWALIFSVATDQTIAMRVGCGTQAGVTPAQSGVFTQPMLEDITELTNKFTDFTAQNYASTNYVANTLSGTSGIVVAGDTIGYPRNSVKTAFGFCTGDSFANGSTEWPQILENIRGATNKSSVMHTEAYSGSGFFNDIGTNYAASLDAYNYTFTIIQGGVNDINGGQTVAQTQVSLGAMVTSAKAKGLKIVICNVAPWKNSVAWSAGEQTITDDYNSWLSTAYTDDPEVEVADIYAALEDPGAADEMLAAYDSGDGLHPNVAGATVIASVIDEKLRSFEALNLGLTIEGSRLKSALWISDFTNAAWVKTNITAAKDATGITGVANSASTLTATAGNGTALQTVTIASAEFTFPVFVKRKTGSGNIDITDNNGTNWTTLTELSSEVFTRYDITRTQANPVIGFRVVTSGDEVEVDFGELEPGAYPTSPFDVTGAADTRDADTMTQTFDPGDVFTWAIEGRTALGLGVQVFGQIDDGGGTPQNNSVRFERKATGNLHIIVTDGGVVQADVDLGFIANDSDFKAAVRVGANDVHGALNGILAATPDTSGTMPTGLTDKYIGSSDSGDHWDATLRQERIWKLGKTNSELQALST